MNQAYGLVTHAEDELIRQLRWARGAVAATALAFVGNIAHYVLTGGHNVMLMIVLAATTWFASVCLRGVRDARAEVRYQRRAWIKRFG